MDPAGGTAAQNTANVNTSDSTGGVKAPEGMDLDAINEAIAATADDASKAPQQTFDVNDISLDNTPTTDAALEQQQAKDPTMNLANSGATPSATEAAPATPVATPDQSAADPLAAAPAAPAAAEGDKPAAANAAFVDGDIVDAPAEEKSDEPAAPEPNYDAALSADPLASFDENATAPTDTPVAEGEAKKEGEGDEEPKSKMKKDIKINIDIDKILHNNLAIIGIVAGLIVVGVIVLIVVTLS